MMQFFSTRTIASDSGFEYDDMHATEVCQHPPFRNATLELTFEIAFLRNHSSHDITVYALFLLEPWTAG